jgi:hypothetical protein
MKQVLPILILAISCQIQKQGDLNKFKSPKECAKERATAWARKRLVSLKEYSIQEDSSATEYMFTYRLNDRYAVGGGGKVFINKKTCVIVRAERYQ